MEKQRTNWLLVVAFCMTLLNANATVLTQTPSVKSVETAAQMSTADLEKTLGRKLTWREKWGMKLLKFQIRKLGQKPTWAPSVNCSKIVLKSGAVIEADILKIGEKAVFYKRCGKATDPEIEESKDNILSVIAEDGAFLFKNDGTQTLTAAADKAQTTTKDTWQYAPIISFFEGLLGVLLVSLGSPWGLLSSALAIVYGFIGLDYIKKNPKKSGDKGLAIIGIVLGGLMLVAFLIALGTVV